VSEKTDSYTLVLGDAGKIFVFDVGQGKGLEIPANSSVAFPVGTRITIINWYVYPLNIGITTDTLHWLNASGGRTTGSAALAGAGSCELYKIGTTTWWLARHARAS